MKLSELRSCDGCRSPIGNQFWVARVSSALLTPRGQRVLSLALVGGSSVADAESITGVHDGVLVPGDKDPALMTEMLLCNACWLHKPLAELQEARNERGRQRVDNPPQAS